MRSSILFGLYRWSTTRPKYLPMFATEGGLVPAMASCIWRFRRRNPLLWLPHFWQGLEHIFVGGVVADSQNEIVIFFFELAGNFRAFVVIGRFYFDHFVSLNDLQFLLYTDRNKFVG